MKKFLNLMGVEEKLGMAAWSQLDSIRKLLMKAILRMNVQNGSENKCADMLHLKQIQLFAVHFCLMALALVTAADVL